MVGVPVIFDHANDVIHDGFAYEPPVDTPSVIPYPDNVVGLLVILENGSDAVSVPETVRSFVIVYDVPLNVPAVTDDAGMLGVWNRAVVAPVACRIIPAVSPLTVWSGPSAVVVAST